MSAFHPRPARVTSVLFGTVLAALSLVHGLQPRQESSRFDRLTVPDPSVIVSPAAVPVDAARLPESLRSRWASFAAANGKRWDVTIDTRSGAPVLVQGEGIPLIPGSGNKLQSAAPVTLDSLASTLRSFVIANADLSLTAGAELTLNREGSGPLTPALWKVVFDRSVAGVPVAGDRWIFFVGHGNLIAFGASRWSAVTTSIVPDVSAAGARAILSGYMGLTDADRPQIVEAPSLVVVPMAAAGSGIAEYSGSVGAGYQTALAWSLAVEVPGEPGKWNALIDAHSGKVLAFEDTIQYAHAKGGAQPISGDGICPDGCEQPNFPMPFADIAIGGSSSTAGSMGSFACTPAGSTATTRLAGPLVKVVDGCGPIAQSVTCQADLDLELSPGTNCNVAVGASPGNTRAARSSFYHLNRIKEHAQVWLPGNDWLPLQLRNNVNLNNTCNAFWSGTGSSGTVNFYRAGNGCGNTGEIAAVFLHEWGHGLDQNDGGGYDNPSEAYADVAAFLMTHTSCIGRGFRSTNCSGYGNVCLNCTGVRDQDWEQRAARTPQTPENWPASCPAGSGPCGRAVHCESALAGQTVWDLAVRDLPASGLDGPTSWQIVDRLWFASRTGSGGNAYTCGAPASTRSCTANSWYTSFRAVDDDDGNLANGTPHAAAIHAAFARHNIPCGAASDATNQNSTICPELPAPTVTATGTANEIALSWSAVTGAASYNVLRNDQGCGWAHTVVANVVGTTYTETGLPNDLPLYYAIQAVGAQPACRGTLSACTAAAAGGPHAIFNSSALVADTCPAGGAGDADSIVDPGERIEFGISLRNDGVATLTGVTATLTPTTPGVVMVRGTAEFGTIAASANASSTAPQFSARLAAGLACGSTVSYDVAIDANEGSWTGSFTQSVGFVPQADATALSENFGSGIPPAWTVVDGGTGAGSAATWTTRNPGGRTFPPPLAGQVAIVDSDAAGDADRQDEQLITPVMDMSAASSVTLDFDEYFRFRSGGMPEVGDVDVSSSLTGGAWVNVLRNQNGSSGSDTAAEHRTVNVTAQAAGASDVRIRFRYSSAMNDWWWAVDNVVVTYTVSSPCVMNPCAPTNAELAVASSGPATAAAGQDIAYTVEIANAGPDAALGVQLAGVVPASTTYRSIAPPAGWSCSAPPEGGTGAITCSTATLPPASSASFTIVVRANACAGDGTIVTSTAGVSSVTPDPDTANDTAVASTTLTDAGACDDGDPCTAGDACLSGACAGIPVGAPTEVTQLTFSSRTNRIWAGLAAVGPAVTYDVVRGTLGDWPVGTGASEQCQASGISDTFVDIEDLPGSSGGFWYLVRARNACGVGTYGSASGGAERMTTICP